jgi:hypothetical protein
MAAAKKPHKGWLLSHDPMDRPLGCNGRYGSSGELAHKRRGEEVCPACLASRRHLRREAKRGNPGTGRRLQPEIPWLLAEIERLSLRSPIQEVSEKVLTLVAEGL